LKNSNKILEAFNNFFGNVARELAKLLPKSTSYSKFLKHPNKSSIFVEAPTSYKIFEIIQKLDINKTPGFDDVFSILLRIIAAIIAPYLSCCFRMLFFHIVLSLQK